MAMKCVFEKFKGKWEIKPVPKSESAKIFWESIINDFSKGNYKIVFSKPNRLTFIFDCGHQ